MVKKILFTTTIFLLGTFGFAQNVSKEDCLKKGENYIFAGGECIQFKAYEGETNEHILVIVHGTWDEGTNTLGRYAPFAETMNLNTDLTTIAIALPGYSNSSTNKFTALAHKGVKNLAAKKKYVEFLGELIKALKNRFEANIVSYIGHSAGAMMGATLTGIKPGLIQNIALAGGRYDIHKDEKDKNLISLVDVLDNINKDTNFLFIYGTKDKISKPEVTTSFYKIMKEKGFKVQLTEVQGAPHIDLDMTDTAIEAITELLDK